MKRLNFLKKKKKVALVLGGGGARGIAHLGVIKFLEENGHSFDFIVGTSAGAVFGALYLKTLNIKKTVQEYLDYIKANNDKASIFNIDNEDKATVLSNIREKIYMAKALFKEGIFEAKPVEQSYKQLFQEVPNIEDLKKKIFIIATDLMTGHDIVFSKGKLIPALMATSALPGIFPPVKFKDYYLIDGGPTQKLPTLIARKLGADKVLAVDVGSKFKKLLKHPTGLKIILRSEELVSCRLHLLNLRYADTVVKPNVGKYKWYEFKDFDEIFNAGYNEAKSKAKEIDAFYTKTATKKVDFDCLKELIVI